MKKHICANFLKINIKTTAPIEFSIWEPVYMVFALVSPPPIWLTLGQGQGHGTPTKIAIFGISSNFLHFWKYKHEICLLYSIHLLISNLSQNIFLKVKVQGHWSSKIAYLVTHLLLQFSSNQLHTFRLDI